MVQVRSPEETPWPAAAPLAEPARAPQPAHLSGGVVLASPFAWPYVHRGAEAIMHGLASWIHRQAVPVSVAAGASRSHRRSIDGVPVQFVGAPDLSRLHRDLDPEMTHVAGLTFALRRARPAVVHCFHPNSAEAARRSGRPWVLSVQGIPLRRSFGGHPLRRRIFERALEAAPVVVVPSRAVAAHLNDEFGVASRVIPNAVAVSAFESTEPRRMGRIFCASTPEDDRKRVPFLVDAFAQIHARNSETELVIAGRASDACREQLRARAPECAGSIRFVGEVTGAELVSLYSSAAVTCLPSLHEAFGMVVIESMAAGTPVVASHHGALPELVDDSVGATFPSDDVDACAVALEAVLERWADPARAQACVERARTYDWSVVGPQFLDVYEEVAS